MIRGWRWRRESWLPPSDVPLDAVSPDVTIAEDGLVVLMTYSTEGYAHLTF